MFLFNKYKNLFYTLFIFLILCILINFLKIDLSIIFSDLHYVIDLLSEMFPPNYVIIWENNLVILSILQTIAMAYLGTLIGGIIAFIFL